MSVQLRTGKTRADGSPIALSPPENLSTRLELFRKGIHLAAIPCIWFVFWQDAVVSWLILVPGSAVALLVDWARIRNVSWVHRILRPLHQLFRRSEYQRDTFLHGINGATWLVVTVALGSLLFSGPVVTLASTVFLLGDAVAALVGRTLGGPRLPYSHKSIFGSMAGGMTMSLTLMLLGDQSLILALSIGLFATTIEAYATWPNDNLTGILGLCVLLSWGL
ncbi:MAG: hypothetical protein EB075_00300 [Bacteroidetes bacterium]|nr:hypothetical protein [Bacteroidota bacterium]